MADVVVRGGTVVFPDGRKVADVRIDGDHIVEVGQDLAGGDQEIDARGLHVFPGLIDIHVHFNEPGRTEWEGGETGSHALAAGGGTVFFDMPLNSSPCTLTARDVDLKRAALEASSVTDFGLWGGLVPGSVEHMTDMASHGVVGFKAFMCDSGLPEFPRADEKTLWAGMREASRLGLPVAVHAEDHEMTRRLTSTMRGTAAADYLASRPVAAEVEAIAQAVEIARETGVWLHIVHVSSGSGVAKVLEGVARGIDVTMETCPHYLFFTADDLERLGVVAKCAPPLRDAGECLSLWTEVREGGVDIIASDHSPTDPALKKEGDFRSSWGGIAGVQSTLAVLCGRSPDGRRIRFERIASLMAATPASRFSLRGKGSLSAGNDADMVLVNPARSATLDQGRLLQRHQASPYLGYPLAGTIVRTIRRGETIFANGVIVATTKGKFIRPKGQP